VKPLAASVGIVLCCLVAVACDAKVDPSFDLNVGDCVEDQAFGEHYSVKQVNCSEPGALRVVHVFDVVGYSAWPGDSVMDSEAYLGCPWSATGYYVPTKESWEQAGDRKIVCLAKAD
jgi:hypothetical protein